MKQFLILVFPLVLINCLTAPAKKGKCLAGNCNEGYGKLQSEEGNYEGEFRNATFNGKGQLNFT
ncbi:MAG TPA: hypothetical protein PLJ29_04630, partial [Leptospiraceae bacterium]|nr:hypothetical protein [Leptospiraceae bacterium]